MNSLVAFIQHVRDETERLHDIWTVSKDDEVGAALLHLHDAAIVVLDEEEKKSQ